MEAATIAIIILPTIFIVLGYAIGVIYASKLFKLQKRLERLAKIKRYHIHHDLVGMLLVLFALILPFASLKVILAGFGIGLFIHHINTEGFKLLTKK